MKLLGKLIYFLLCLILFLELSIYFLPKKQLLNYANIKLNSYFISFSSKQVKDRGFKLILDDTTFKYDKLPMATSKEITLFSLLFIDKIIIKDIYLSDVASDILPKKVDLATLYWTPLQGYKIKVYAKGEIGKATGYIDLFHRKIILYLQVTQKAKRRYSNILRQMQKEAKGYKYVKSF